MTVKKKNQIIGSLMLALCSFIWGVAFVAQSKGAEAISPMWFTCLRNVLACIVLFPVILVLDKRKKKKGEYIDANVKGKKFFVFGSFICGLSLAVASFLQQFGLTKGTNPGKAGFITALYIILVPIFSIVLKKKIRPLIWLCVGMAIAGLYLLCVTENNSLQMSDFIVFLCAIMFSVQILAVEYVMPYVDGVKLAAGQYFFAAICSLAYAVFFEPISIQNIKDGLIPLLYAGIFSSGVAFTLQITGQQRLENPTVASLLMSFESVFAVLASAVILHQIPSAKEAIGCVIMFVAIIIAQLPEKKKLKKQKVDL